MVSTGIRVVNIAEWVLPVIVEINSLLLDWTWSLYGLCIALEYANVAISEPVINDKFVSLLKRSNLIIPDKIAAPAKIRVVMRISSFGSSKLR